MFLFNKAAGCPMAGALRGLPRFRKHIWVLLLLAAMVFSACQAVPTEIPETPIPAITEASSPSPDPTHFDGTPSLVGSPPPATQPEPSPTPEGITPSPEASPTPATVTTFPDAGFTRWQPFASGLDRPVGLANAGDGSGRLFVLEQEGIIRIILDGIVQPEPFLDIRNRIRCCGERGLLGLAFHPAYHQNGYFYVNYTDGNGDTVIARYRVSDDPDRAQADSEMRLLHIRQPYPNHNGGAVVFGPDGYLYLGLGDGGSGGDPHNFAQSLDTLLGKILRLSVDSAEPYAIPHDNPFIGEPSGVARPEIWAYGLRNPWRIAFDSLTGDLYIADVGQSAWEEINFLPAGSPGGANFGWRYFEGSQPFRDTPSPDLELVFPVAEYDHGHGCSVTGGEVYRGAALPTWQGVYLYGDYCSGIVWGLLRGEDGSWQNELLFETGARITSFGLDEDGEIYLVDHGGTIYRLEASSDASAAWESTSSRLSNDPVGTPTPESIRFAVIGDYGSGNRNAAAVAELVKSWDPDFIITTGDNNYPKGSADTIDRNIGQFYHGFIYPYIGSYGEGASYNRFFPSLGNHDWDTPGAKPYLDYFTLPGNERYYDFTWGPVHFFALNGDWREPDGVSANSRQARWLQEGLAGSDAPWRVVYVHHPPFSSGMHGSIRWMRWPFKEWGTSIVLAGHDHVYERLSIDGFPYITNGLGGGAIYRFREPLEGSMVRYNENYGAMLVEADAQRMIFEFITIEGEVIDRFMLVNESPQAVLLPEEYLLGQPPILGSGERPY